MQTQFKGKVQNFVMDVKSLAGLESLKRSQYSVMQN